MAISISLLSALLFHLTIIVLAIGIVEYYELIKEIIYLHMPSIILCLVTAIAYLFKKELNPLLFDVRNIPETLLYITFISAILSIIRSWITVFQFFDYLNEHLYGIKENKQK